MFIEDIEKHDWNIETYDNNTVRKQKSIEAYWLHNWYERVKDITFETFIYKNENDIPDILPFEKCMIRYENKSPKDSDFWGPCSTKKELLNIFHTSLRCKTNPGKYYCVRKWVELGDEYRCFWNNGLVAISAELDCEPPIDQILEYISKIQDKLFYKRCVFDISHIKDTNELIFVEYNSWESNSGAHRFNWLDDTEVFYGSNNITIRWLNGEKTVNSELAPKNNYITSNTIDMQLYKPIKLQTPTNWLITEKCIYITNDIWLGRFDFNLKPINWKRGVFRFSEIQLCEDGCILVDSDYYYYELTPKKTPSNVINQNATLNDNTFKFKYVIPVLNLNNNKIEYIRMLDNCKLILEK